MNCDLLQRRLLTLEDPGRPPAEMREHLAGCSACRSWQLRLLDLERSVPLLPVPPSAGRDAFVGRLLAGARTRPAGTRRQLSREQVLRKVALVTALAAGLLMFFIGFSAWQWPTTGPARFAKGHGDAFLARLLGHDLDLAQTADARRRLRSLTGLADALSGQAGPLARAGADEDLGTLAGLYGRVLQDGILHQASAARAERVRAADQLDEEARHADELAGGLADPCAAPLREMAEAARKAEEGLRGGAARRPEGGAAWSRAGAAWPGPVCVAAPTVGTLLAASVAPTPVPAPDGEAPRFHRNRALIERLVGDGVDLAREDDPVKRADRCYDIAHGLAQEIATAGGGDSGRVAELGQHLGDVLQNGVALNLKTARDRIPVGSAEEKKLQQVQAETRDVVFDLETRLAPDEQTPEEVRSALRAINAGWDAVEYALRASPAGR